MSPGKTGDEEALTPLSRTAEEGQRLRTAATTALREFLPMTVELPRTWPADANSPRRPTTDDGRRAIDAFSLFNPPLGSLASLTEDDFRRIFRHSPIKRVKYPGWLRNLCVAMGNSGDPRFIPALRELSQHADPIVREHAAWALARLQPR
jgi:HEAT repeat protein